MNVSWKQNNCKFLKIFHFIFGLNMVIMFVCISWTTGLFLRYFSFGKMYSFQILPCRSHLIILIPLLGSVIFAFFLKMLLVPQSNRRTLSNHGGDQVYFRKYSLGNFPSDPVIKAPCFSFRRHGFDPWSGN